VVGKGGWGEKGLTSKVRGEGVKLKVHMRAIGGGEILSGRGSGNES